MLLIYICNFILSVKVKDNSKRIILTMKIVKLISTWNFRSDYWKINNSERNSVLPSEREIELFKKGFGTGIRSYFILYWTGHVLFVLFSQLGKIFFNPCNKNYQYLAQSLTNH